ncbi:hypothetical protein GTY66_06875 [Streptomyces sp. SID8356]|uniref:hypothetical protein n=1 Tax=unclassified Streptomyces TaxID=2593676 RepID=UPI00037337A7|nr:MULTISPECIES: hypothetical protein [unclassified Streptomyces]MYT35779.1 hypothetical protein [Streptomyces sp. SID8356]
MSTTRHLVNRRRRLATSPTRPSPAAELLTRPTEETATEPEPETAADAQAQPAPEPEPGTGTGTAAETEAEPEPPRRTARRPRSAALPALLCALTVLLGAFAAWAFGSAAALRDEPARQNTALTDIARTSEVKGRIGEAVGAVFSYDYASPARADRAAETHLTGRAVRQHKDMLAEVREQGEKQKLVLTTTVTASAVEYLDGDRARLLVFADQSNTRTGKDEETTYAAAMFAVDAVRRGDTWRIAAIDTFTR